MTHSAHITRSVFLFAKPPMMGLSKTRLASGIGRAEARRIARFTLARTLRAAQASDPRWQLTLYTSPRRHLHATLGTLWPPSLGRRDQGDGDLGTRLSRALANAPRGPVLFIGADCPDISPALIWKAFKSLRRHDAVIGPAEDGGFWLLGLHAKPRGPNPFHPVRWSTAHALEDVIANLPAGFRCARLPTLLDIDEAIDWTRWQGKN